MMKRYGSVCSTAMTAILKMNQDSRETFGERDPDTIACKTVEHTQMLLSCNENVIIGGLTQFIRTLEKIAKDHYANANGDTQLSR